MMKLSLVAAGSVRKDVLQPAAWHELSLLIF